MCRRLEGGGDMQLEQAQQIAEALKVDLEPFCECIEIGGSIRRRKPEPNDIELVCIPKFGDYPTGQMSLEGDPLTSYENLLFEYIVANRNRFGILKMGKKYCQLELDTPDLIELPGIRFIIGTMAEPIKVDIFTATFQTWGYIFMLRTGPWEFSKFVVTELKKNGFTLDAGEIFHHGTPYTVPTEEDLFFLLGIDYIPPECRFKDAMWK